MNRSARAHRSTKVPGVKLRPAPSDADAGGSGSAKRARRDASRADADEDAAHFRALRDAQRSREEQLGPEGSETARDWAERPLRGATLCMTGLGSEEKVRVVSDDEAGEEGASTRRRGAAPCHRMPPLLTLKSTRSRCRRPPSSSAPAATAT